MNLKRCDRCKQEIGHAAFTVHAQVPDTAWTEYHFCGIVCLYRWCELQCAVPPFGKEAKP